MAAHEDRADEYRQKADELRAMLPDMKDRLIREVLENLAAGYDQLARTQDSLAKTDKFIEKR